MRFYVVSISTNFLPFTVRWLLPLLLIWIFGILLQIIRRDRKRAKCRDSHTHTQQKPYANEQDTEQKRRDFSFRSIYYCYSNYNYYYYFLFFVFFFFVVILLLWKSQCPRTEEANKYIQRHTHEQRTHSHKPKRLRQWKQHSAYVQLMCVWQL